METQTKKQRQFAEILAGLDAINDKMDDLAVFVQQQTELLRQIAASVTGSQSRANLRK